MPTKTIEVNEDHPNKAILHQLAGMKPSTFFAVLLLLVLALLAGCRVVYPGDGRRVPVRFDAGVLERPIAYRDEAGTMRPVLLKAFEWWSSAGVNFDLARSGEGGALPTRSDPWWEGATRDAWGDYDEASGEIYLFQDLWGLDDGRSRVAPVIDADNLTAVFAHELGHAVGLDHDPHAEALMHSPPGQPYGLTEWDYAALVARWP